MRKERWNGYLVVVWDEMGNILKEKGGEGKRKEVCRQSDKQKNQCYTEFTEYTNKE